VQQPADVFKSSGGRIVLANGEAAMVQSARAFDTFSFALEQSASSATVVVI
jgi:hypothetical protein